MRDVLHRFRCVIMAFLAIAVLGGCATSATPPPSEQIAPAPAVEPEGLTRALYDQLQHWRGTQYRLGGLGRNGIDCSGLTYVVYRDLFGRQLPRTTDAQVDVGRPVKRSSLAPGDLVFFKTGVFQKHVGIYVSDDLFLHASQSSGVRLSSLASDYWRDRYWKARRVPIDQAGI